MTSITSTTRRLSVAPMMDWTDRHCRYFHRLITKNTLLYTEMVTTGALRFGNASRLLAFDDSEHPVALQLGGSEPEDLAICAKLGEQFGYDEINLNCGCPSPRVQKGAFGACLMQESALVADCVKAMRDSVSIPVTIKHRIGLGREESYDFVRDFIGTVSDAGCDVFIVHARNAWLEGLSPKENRTTPPLRYEIVYRLKREFPHLSIILNGGVVGNEFIVEHLKHLDGVMVGREAYHNPWIMSVWDEMFYADTPSNKMRADMECAYVSYMCEQWKTQQMNSVTSMSKHMLGLYNGIKGARHWRQMWSDAQYKKLEPSVLYQLVLAQSLSEM